jgi:hypothetical protein
MRGPPVTRDKESEIVVLAKRPGANMGNLNIHGAHSREAIQAACVSSSGKGSKAMKWLCTISAISLLASPAAAQGTYFRDGHRMYESC